MKLSQTMIVSVIVLSMSSMAMSDETATQANTSEPETNEAPPAASPPGGANAVPPGMMNPYPWMMRQGMMHPGGYMMPNNEQRQKMRAQMETIQKEQDPQKRMQLMQEFRQSMQKQGGGGMMQHRAEMGQKLDSINQHLENIEKLLNQFVQQQGTASQ